MDTGEDPQDLAFPVTLFLPTTNIVIYTVVCNCDTATSAARSKVMATEVSHRAQQRTEPPTQTAAVWPLEVPNISPENYSKPNNSDLKNEVCSGAYDLKQIRTQWCHFISLYN